MPPSVTSFTHAIARRPGDSVIHGLRVVDRGAPDLASLRREHAGYVDTLTRVGVTVEMLEPLESYPDSMFVEDPALVFREAAILLRPGAPSRRGEGAALEPSLRTLFPEVLSLPGEGHADGGDVLLTPEAVYIGLSARTDAGGAAALVRLLGSLGRRVRVVTPPAGVLHLKTACSLVEDHTLLATRALAEAALFPDLDVVVVPEGEEPVANALRVNGAVLIADGFPKTAALLARRGYDVRLLALDQVMKLDAGLSCMSLRW